jgi:putative transposase
MQARVIEEKVVAKERKKEFEISRISRFRHRIRYFTDSGLIGSKEFVAENYRYVFTTLLIRFVLNR